MNWLDAAIILVTLWFTFTAFQAGFIREVVTLTSAVLGLILAGLFYEDLAEDVLVFIDNETLALIVGFAVIFGAVFLAGQIMAMILKPTVNLLQLGIFDQLAGAGFGFFKAMVLIQVFLVLFVTYPKWDMEEHIEGSFFGSLIVENVAVVEYVLPADFGNAIDNFTSDFPIDSDNEIE